MQDPVKRYVTRNVIHTGVALYQICASVRHVRNTAAADMADSQTLTTRLVMLSARETTAMTRPSLSGSGTGLVIVTDVQTPEERLQKIT